MSTKGSELVDVPQSDGSSIKVPQWKASGARSLSQWVDQQANPPAKAATSAAAAPNGIVRNAVFGAPAAPTSTSGNISQTQTADPVLRQALSDPTYKLQTPKAVSGQTATPAALDQQKATVAARTDLLKDSQDATSTSAQSLQYLQAAKAIMQGQGKPVTGLFGPIANEVTRLYGGVNSTNYQEVAKYLSNAALQNAKANYGQRMTQSEVGLQLNELSPSTKMTDDAINNLIDSNARSAQYTIDSAKRSRVFLANGGDPQQFSSWNQQYYPREKIVNTAPTRPGQGSSGAAASVPKISSATDYARLSKGAQYIDPNGVTRTKGN